MWLLDIYNGPSRIYIVSSQKEESIMYMPSAKGPSHTDIIHECIKGFLNLNMECENLNKSKSEKQEPQHTASLHKTALREILVSHMVWNWQLTKIK